MGQFPGSVRFFVSLLFDPPALWAEGGSMKIPIAGMSNGEQELTFSAEAATIGLEEEFSTVRVSAIVEKQNEEIRLDATIATEKRCVCDRCLAEFRLSLSPVYTMHYVFSEAEASRFDPAEVVTLAPGTPSLDIADDVRQMVLMAVPLKLLCKETCLGLCPSCGRNLNEGSCQCRPETADSRWDALRDLGSGQD